MVRKGRIEETCRQCGKQFITWECRKKKGWGKFCSNKCGAQYNAVNTPLNIRKEKASHLHKNGSNHPSWRGGRKVDKNGYIYVWVGYDYPNATADGYLFEHRYVLEKQLKRHLKPNEVIHHKDGNKQNNRIDNLELCDSHAEHIAQHMSEKYNLPIMNYEWHPIFKHCKECKKTDRRHQGKGLCARCYLKEWKKKKTLLIS